MSSSDGSSKLSVSDSHSSGAKNAAKTLMSLWLASADDASIDDADSCVSVNPNPTASRPSILPPWQWKGAMFVSSGMVAGTKDRKETQGRTPALSMMDVIPRFDEDDISLSQSFYAGAGHDHHRPRDGNNDEGVRCYKYKDFSKITFAEVADVHADPKNSTNFPVILHRVLSCDHYRESIMWFLNGRAFAIIDKEKFFKDVSPNYFCTSDYGLFERWIEAYGFNQVEHGRGHAGKLAVFFHERFLRYRPWLAFTMKPGGSRNEDGNDDVPSHARVSADHIQELFQYFELIPALQEVMVPYSTLFITRKNFLDPQHTAVVSPVAHPFLPESHTRVFMEMVGKDSHGDDGGTN